jgi:hypothetical protein
MTIAALVLLAGPVMTIAALAIQIGSHDNSSISVNSRQS